MAEVSFLWVWMTMCHVSRYIYVCFFDVVNVNITSIITRGTVYSTWLSHRPWIASKCKDKLTHTMHTVTYLRMPFTFFQFSSFIWDICDTSVLWCSCTPSLMEGAPPKPPKYPTKIVSSMFNPVKMTGGASPGPSPNPDSKIREGPTTNGQRLGWLPMMFLKTRLYSENNLFHFLLSYFLCCFVQTVE